MWIMDSLPFTCSFPFSNILKRSILHLPTVIPPPRICRLAHTIIHPLAPIPHGDSNAVLCNVMLLCMCDLTSPLPCYCSADRCCPTLHSHNPCDPNLHCPCGARCHLFINVTGLFLFLYFPSTHPPSFIFLLSSCWSFFLIPAIPLLVDGPEGLSAPESGKVPRLPLTNSICVSTSRRKWKAPQKDRQRD